jgi:hypothetical protein
VSTDGATGPFASLSRLQDDHGRRSSEPGCGDRGRTGRLIRRVIPDGTRVRRHRAGTRRAAGRPRRHTPSGRVHLRHRADGAHLAGPDCGCCASREHPSANLHELLPMRRLDPAYRACFADGSTIHVRSGREAVREEIAQTVAALTRPLSTRSLTGFASSIWWRCRTSSTGITTPHSACLLPLTLLPSWYGWVLSTGCELRYGALHRPPPPLTVQFSGCVCRTRARLGLALYAVITYMDTIEEVWFPEGGIHAVPTMMAQVAVKAGVTFRYDDQWKRSCGRRPRSGCWCWSGSWPTPWSALLIFRPRMKSCLVIFVRHERRGASRTRPRRSCGTLVYAACRRLRSRITTSTLVRNGLGL